MALIRERYRDTWDSEEWHHLYRTIETLIADGSWHDDEISVEMWGTAHLVCVTSTLFVTLAGDVELEPEYVLEFIASNYEYIIVRHDYYGNVDVTGYGTLADAMRVWRELESESVEGSYEILGR